MNFPIESFDSKTLLTHLKIVYYTLRQMKQQNRENYDPDEYKWNLGIKVIGIINSESMKPIELSSDEAPTLFGIKVDINYVNPNNLQLFEDITNKISVKVEE